MGNYRLPYFGQLDTEKLDEYYDAQTDLSGNEIQLDLNFDETTISTDQLDSVKRFLEQAADFDFKMTRYIQQDYEDATADTVRTYIEHHLEELGEDELNELIDYNNKAVVPARQLLKQFRLVRMGFYPHNAEHFAVFDYSIDPELTNYLVVIYTDQNGQPSYITMES